MSDRNQGLPKRVAGCHHVYFIRHSAVNIGPNICYGQLDCDLKDTFANDLQHLQRYLSQLLVAPLNPHDASQLPYIISSPLTRCMKLAEGLQQQLTLKSTLQINHAFKEINFGQWEGRNWLDIGKDALDEWSNNVFDFNFPEGESARTFHQRVIKAWDQLQDTLLAQESAQTILVVTHAGVIRSIFADFLQIPLQHSLSLTIDPLSLSCLALKSQQPALSRCLCINQKI